MADIPSALPVRSEADVDQRLQVKIVDSTTPGANQMAVDAQSNAQVMAHGRDAGGVSRTLLTDTGGRLILASPEDADAVDISDYATAAAVAANGTANHDYAPAATKTFKLEQVWASGSGKIKIEVQVGPVGTLVTKAVGFNSTAVPNINMALQEAITVTNPAICRVIVTNLDKNAQDVYSTILGDEK